MNGVSGLAEVIKNGLVKTMDKQEMVTKRGLIQNGRVRIGAESYPFVEAVECSTDEGNLVWVVISKNGTAVIVGA